MKITISNAVSEKRKLDDYDYLGRFLLQFHALIDVYPADFLGWEPVPELLTIYIVLLPCLLSTELWHWFSTKCHKKSGSC